MSPLIWSNLGIIPENSRHLILKNVSNFSVFFVSRLLKIFSILLKNFGVGFSSGVMFFILSIHWNPVCMV